MSGICPVCGGVKLADQPYCNHCVDTERADYYTVRNYLRSFPNSNAMQVANATGISVSKILKYVREGALAITQEDGGKSSRFGSER